jgi:hypothetical protein
MILSISGYSTLLCKTNGFPVNRNSTRNFPGARSENWRSGRAELRKSAQGDEESRGLSAARLAAFLEKAEGHQAWLLQRLKDLESHPILDTLVFGPRADAPTKRSTPLKRPMEERSPVDLAEVPIYGEYR